MISTERQTGYPSIDKPWLKYYGEEAINSPLPEGSIYDYMCDCNKNRLDKVAVNYFGKKITHRSLQENIDACAKALLACGVRYGDFVSCCMLAIPETVYLFYAINRIGAISNFVELNVTQKQIEKQITDCHSKAIFVVDLAVDKILHSISKNDSVPVVIVPMAASMPKGMKFIASAKASKIKKNRKLILWKNFLKKGKSSRIPDICINSEKTAVIEYTGGTTGDPKGVMLSNRAVNALAFNYISASDILEFKKGQTYLDIIPPFLGYGLFFGIHMPLCLGLQDILSPDPDPLKFPYLLMKYKPNHFSGGPMHLQNMMKHRKVKKMNLSFLVSAAWGGDGVNKKWEETVSAFLKKHGAAYGAMGGYGLTETASAFCIKTHHTEGMVPFAKNNVRIMDLDTGEEVSYGQEGEILLSGPTLMDGYYHNPGATKEAIFEDNGVKWLRTGDIGYITEDGIFNITGRIKRILYAAGADNIPSRIYPMAIEDVICSHLGIQNCVVVGKPNGKKGYLPIAFIVLKKGADEERVIAELKKLCRQELPENSLPYKYYSLEAIPLTAAGKVDYRDLENRVESIAAARMANDSK